MTEKIRSKKQRIIYFSLLAVLIVLIGVITTLAIVNANSNFTDSLDTNVDTGNTSVTPDPVPDPTPDEPEPSDEPDTPVVEVISFIMPVDGGTVIKDYTDNTVVYSLTLGVYTGHMGIDFSGEEGAAVYAVYKGTVKEITTSYLEGTTITIDHGNGLYTVYNSIEPLETLSVGLNVAAGTQIGTISTNNKQEYKDGAHLHFEVIEDGKNISPLKYLTIEEK